MAHALARGAQPERALSRYVLVSAMKRKNVRRRQWERWCNRTVGVVPRAYFRQAWVKEFT